MFSLFDAVYGPRLNKLLTLKSSMPSEAFFKLLAKNNAASKANEEAGSRSGLAKETVGDATEPVAESSPGLLKDKDKDRKRHRDGGASRHHHHKKLKDSAKVVLVEDSDQTVKEKDEGLAGEVLKPVEGVEPVEGRLVKVDAPPRGSVSIRARALAVCKDHVENVIFLLIFTFLLTSLFCSFPCLFFFFLLLSSLLFFIKYFIWLGCS